MFADGVHLLFTPTTPTPAFPIGATTDPYAMYLNDIFTATANLAGVPAMSLPIGRVDGLPVGGQFIAPHVRGSADVLGRVRARAGARRGGPPMSDGARDALAARYEMVVGLEVHVQLKTATKMFCGCSTAFGAPPNTNICPVCLALPGALPVLNAQAVGLAVRAALALGCTVHAVSIFARKNYFYPDLPKGYQISQFDRPLATDRARSPPAGDTGAASRASTWKRTPASPSTTAIRASPPSTSTAPACRSSRS